MMVDMGSDLEVKVTNSEFSYKSHFFAFHFIHV